jgi:hypothetical protein
MLGPRPDAGDEAELLDAVEPLERRRVDQREVVALGLVAIEHRLA